jgi:hypothetical protein
MTVTEQWPPATAERVVVVVGLKQGTRDQAAELLKAGPPFDPAAIGFRRHSVYLSAAEAVFCFEGPAAGRRLVDVVDDLGTSPSFSSWAPILRGTPRLAHEYYFWTAST